MGSEGYKHPAEVMRRAIVLLLILLAGCGRSEQWSGWVYPDVEDMNVTVTVGTFSSFDECQAATIGMVRALDRQRAEHPNLPDRIASYECGRGCRFEARYGIQVCKETRK